MDIDTKALRAIREQATAGEWRRVTEGPFDYIHATTTFGGTGEEIAAIVNLRWQDAALITAAVNNLIPLLDEIDRLRAENAALNSELAGHREWDEENQLDRAALYADMDEVE